MRRQEGRGETREQTKREKTRREKTRKEKTRREKIFSSWINHFMRNIRIWKKKHILSKVIWRNQIVNKIMIQREGINIMIRKTIMKLKKMNDKKKHFKSINQIVDITVLKNRDVLEEYKSFGMFLKQLWLMLRDPNSESSFKLSGTFLNLL